MPSINAALLKKGRAEWKDWVWQQRNAVKDVRELKGCFPMVEPAFFERLHEQSGSKLRFQMTPYMVSQIPGDITEKTIMSNPWAAQSLPLGDIYAHGPDAYDGTDNWEKSGEFPTSNLQHKYTNRVLVRFRNCLAYCNFCFESLGVLEKKPSEEKTFHWSDWQKSLEYIRHNPVIEEVILSGGEPLLLSDQKLEEVLQDISNVKDEKGKPKVRFKRIHTRVLTHNPFRVTTSLAEIIARHRINEMALSVAHPSEITPEFMEAVYRIREVCGKYAPLMVLHTDLLKGFNDNVETLWELFARAYENNIKPYYLLHAMPHTPYADRQRTSVRDGVRLMKALKRHKSNIAIPEYIIVHHDGKQTVPLELEGTPEFQYTVDSKGNPIIRFLNWKGNWVEYPDAPSQV